MSPVASDSKSNAHRSATSRRRRLLIGCSVVAAAMSGAAGAIAADRTGWVWFEGDSVASVGHPAGTEDLVLHAAGSINFRAGHIRLGSNSGRYLFEHGPSSANAMLLAYYIGTPTRTPIQIGNGDGQKVTPLVVAGTSGQKSDLQQWTASGEPVAAIDAQGRLRIGSITIYPKLEDGRVVLMALLPDGSVQRLTPAGT
jgi:hypothetical protein